MTVKKKESPLRIFAVADESVLAANCHGVCESQFPEAGSVKVIGKVKKSFKDKRTYLIDFGLFAGEMKLDKSDLDFIIDTTGELEG